MLTPYRKKPRTILAMRVTLETFETGLVPPGVYIDPSNLVCTVLTSGGRMHAGVGDWIGSTQEGGLFTCSNEHFQNVFEAV